VHPEASDVNGDGACNIGDALRIAQCDVGLICAFTCGQGSQAGRREATLGGFAPPGHRAGSTPSESV